MMKFLRIAALALVFIPTVVFGQGVGQLQPGQVLGNVGATKAPGTGVSITAAIDKAFCTTQNALLLRGASNWACLTSSNSSVLVTSAGGAVSWSTTLPSGLAATNMTLTTPTLGVATGTSLALGGASIGSNALAVTGTSLLTGAVDIVSNATAALQVGQVAAGNVAFQVNASAGSLAAGLQVSGAATGGTVALAAIDTGSNTNLSINGKGTGTISIGNVSSGVVNIGAGGLNINSTNTLTGIGTGVPAALATALSANGGVPTVVAHGTATLGTSAIASGACATVVTSTATGAATTDIIDAVFNADPTGTTGYTAPNMLTIMIYPTSNTANFKVCNNTNSSITPGAVTLNWAVRR